MALNDVWPDFLDRLDRQPQRAVRELYEFSFRLVQVAPPATFRSLPHDIAVDVLYDIVASLIKDNFSLLRTYQNEGRPFALWLRKFVRERSNEWITRLHAESSFPADHNLPSYLGQPEDISPTELTEVSHKVRSALDSMDCLSKLVLELSADELRPREIARLLKCPDARTQDVELKLEFSRRTFKEALKMNGVELVPTIGSPDNEERSRYGQDG